MKLFKEINLLKLIIYSFGAFLLAVLLLIIYIITISIKTNKKILDYNRFETLHSQLKDLDKYQDVVFLYKRTNFFKNDAIYSQYEKIVYSLVIYIDDMSVNYDYGNSIYKEEFSEIQRSLAEYKKTQTEIYNINIELYDPSSGLEQQLSILANRITTEPKFKELNLLDYFNQLQTIKTNLFSKKINKEEFIKLSLKIFEKISNLDVPDAERPYYLLFENNFTDYYNKTLIIYDKKSKIGFDYTEGLLNEINIAKNNLFENNEKILKNIIVSSQSSQKTFYIYIAFIFIVLTLYLAVIFYYINQKLVKNWKIIEPFLSKLSQLFEPQDIPVITDFTEYEILTKNIVKLSENLLAKTHIINDLTKRQYDIEYEPDEEDLLGKAIVELKSDLVKAQKEAETFHRTEEQQKWHATGIAKIGAVMRQSTENINILANNVLKEILEYMEAQQGAFFIYNKDENILQLTASYSYGKQRTKNQVIKPYEGLIGTILIEKREYYYAKIPDNYIFFETGFGYSKPQSLFAFPLLFEQNLFGVIEIAALKEIPEYKRKFLLSLANEIAITISYTQINQQTKLLLEQSEKQAKELKSNEKLYKKNQDNLKSLLRMTEQKLNELESELKYKEELLQQKINDLLKVEKEIMAKEEYIENLTNEYENIKSELQNQNKELRKRIEELEKRLNKDE